MIEVVRFGVGFPAEGPDWGVRGRPYLENGWRQVGVGVHNLDSADAITNQLTVLPDGTGRLNPGLSQSMQLIAARDPMLMAELFGQGTAEGDFLINGDAPVVPVLTLSTRDIQANVGRLVQNPTRVLGVMRLAGLVRYNP